MELEEVLHEKELMEKEIFNFVLNRVEKFRNTTGLYPTAIDLLTTDITEIGQHKTAISL